MTEVRAHRHPLPALGRLVLLCAAFGVGIPGQALADEGADLFRSKGCIACHGDDGSRPTTPDYPVVAGQSAVYLVRQMRDIRDGRRANGLSEAMRVKVSGVTDAEFSLIADWLASRW